MRKLVRIGSNARIPGDSHYKNKKYCSYSSKKIEMRKMTMPNFCINFLNKAAKLLPILYDFTVASLMDAWIKIMPPCLLAKLYAVASLADAWIKIFPTKDFNGEELSHPSRMRGLKLGHWQPPIRLTRRIPRGCVD